MAASKRTGREPTLPLVLTAAALLLLFPLALSTPSVGQMLVQPELAFDANVHPHDEPLAPGGTGHVMIDVIATCKTPGVFMDPVDILFSFQTWPSFGIEVRPEAIETELAFSPEECAATSSERSIVLEPEFSFTHAFHDPVKIELWAQHQGQREMVVVWHEPPGVHADWEASFEQRGTIMVDTLIPMKGEVQNNGNVPIEVEIIVRDPPRYGRLDHPERLTVATARDGGGTQSFHLEYRADRVGQERFAILLRATTAEGPEHTLEPHLARVSFDVVERQSATIAGLDDPEEGFPAGTLLLLLLAAGAIALLVWRKDHRPQDTPLTPETLHQGPPAEEDGPEPLAHPGPPAVPGAFHVKEIRAPER